MGEWNPATHAYMVYTDENGIREGNPAMPTIPAIYKIRVTQVRAFQEKFNIAGAKWVPVYSMHDWTDSIGVKDMEIDGTPQDKKSKRTRS